MTDYFSSSEISPSTILIFDLSFVDNMYFISVFKQGRDLNLHDPQLVGELNRYEMNSQLKNGLFSR